MILGKAFDQMTYTPSRIMSARNLPPLPPVASRSTPKQFRRGANFLAGTTGIRLLNRAQDCSENRLEDHHLQSLLALETRMNRPPEVPSRADFLSLAIDLESLARLRSTEIFSPRVLGLSDAFFRYNTALGGGLKPGVVAIAIDHRIVTGEWDEHFRRARQASKAAYLPAPHSDDMKDCGSGYLDTFTFTLAGSTGNAVVNVELERAAEGRSGRALLLVGLGPHLVSSTSGHKEERANAAACIGCLELHLQKTGAAFYMTDGPASDFEDVQEDAAVLVAMHLQNESLDAAAGPEANDESAIRGWYGHGAPFRNLYVFSSLYFPMRIVQFREAWIARLGAFVMEQVVQERKDDLPQPDRSLLSLVEEYMKIGFLDDPNQLKLDPQTLRKADERYKNAWATGRQDTFAEDWADQLHRILEQQTEQIAMDLAHAGLTAANSSPLSQREEVLTSFIQHLTEQASEVRKLLARIKQRQTEIPDDIAHYTGQQNDTLLWLTSVEEVALTAAAEVRELLPALDYAIEVLKRWCQDAADDYTAGVADLARWQRKYTDQKRVYENSLRKTPRTSPIPLQDDHAGPLPSGNGSSPPPLEKRMELAMRKSFAYLRSFGVGDWVNSEVERVDHLEHEANRALPPAQGFVETVGTEIENTITEMARLANEPPGCLDPIRLKGYGCNRQAIYVHAHPDMHEILKQYGFSAARLIPSDDPYSVRIRTVQIGVSPWCIEGFPDWVADYLALKNEEGAALHCPLPWREADMLEIFRQGQEYDDALTKNP